MVLWRPTRLFRTNQKRCPFHYRGLESKVVSQETPGVTGKFGLGIRNEAGQRLIQFCQENALVIANTLFQQHKRRLYSWTSPDGQHWNQIDYILCSQRWRSSIQSEKIKTGSWLWLRSWTLPGASVRNSARGKGHEEGGSAYAKAGSSLRSPPGNSRASTPKTRVCLLYCFVLLPTPLTLRGAVPHHFFQRRS